MVRWLQRPAAVLIAAAGVSMAIPACEVAGPGGNDNTTGQLPDDGTGLTAARTSIEVAAQAMLLAGDDVIVYGTGATHGVDFIVPSAGDTSGRGIAGSDDFVSRSFAVGGRMAYFVGDDFQVTAYHTGTRVARAIPLTDIRLKGIPVSPGAVGHIRADGDYCVVICDETAVTDGLIIKLIDASGATPQVVPFTNNPVAQSAHVQQVAIHAESRQVVVSAGGDFYLFDIDQPTVAGVLFEAVGAGIGDAPMAFDGQFVLYADRSGLFNAVALDLAANSNATMGSNPAGTVLSVAGGSFGYFLRNGSVGSHLRSAIGVLESGVSASLAVVTSPATNGYIDGSSNSNGLVGYGQSMAVTPDGGRWFIAGAGAIGAGEYLQTSTGGDFTVMTDPAGLDALGCPASDVSASSNTVAFKSGDATTTTLGYIRLE